MAMEAITGRQIERNAILHAIEKRQSDIELQTVTDTGLAGFIKKAWHIVVPKPLRWNWHHDLMCHALERVTAGEIRNLIIALPPSCSKSLFVSVFWPAWEWTMDPGQSYIFGSYGDKLTLKCARQHRDLVNSNWYHGKWHNTSIPHQNTHAASWFENRSKGFRFSGTVGGDVTGRHSGRLVGDDLNKAQEVYGSELAVVGGFDKSWNYWDAVLTTRVADPTTIVRVLAGHRLHRDDVAGRWMRQDPSVHVIALPMRYDPNHPNLHPDDPRTEEGELLWPSRWTEEAVKKFEHRPSEFAAQFQQNPLPPGGNLILDEYLSHRYSILPSEIQRTIESKRAGAGQTWITSWDMTFKGKATSDLVVGQVWCRFEGGLYLIDQVKKRMGFRETKQAVRDLAAAYPWVRKHIMEDAANAAAIEDDLKGSIPGVLLEPHGGGVLARCQQCEGAYASGWVRIPASAQWLGGGDGFIAEHLAFDGLGTRHDDQVSASSLAILHLIGSKTNRWTRAMKAAGSKEGVEL